MLAQLHDTAGGLWADQAPGSRLTYRLEHDLQPGEALTASTWAALPTDGTPPLTFTGAATAGNAAQVDISGGMPGRWYAVTNTATTSTGQISARSFMLLIAAPLPAQGSSALWPFPPAAVAEVRRQRLFKLATTHLSGITITDDEVWSKLLAAEAEAERNLRVWLTPREVLPALPDQDDEAAALVAAGQRVAREPGYDYEPAMFQGDRWGLLELRQRPVSVVRWARFAFPGSTATAAELPAAWLRPEGRTNKVSIVPTGGWPASLNAFVVSVLGGGRTVPFMLQIAYRAGIENVREALPDLPGLLMRSATLSLVQDLLPASSGSVSADGLSQSISFEADKHAEAIGEKMAKMRDRLHGPRITFA